MDDQISKNIIIILLVGLVIGLLGVIFITSSDSGLTDDETAANEDKAELEGTAGGEDVSESVLPAKNTPQQEKTALPVPVVTSLPQTDVSEIELDQSVVIVTYTDSGFIPSVVEVTAGNSVTFINSSSKPMWVTSEDHPTAKGQVYRGFDQGKSVSNGGTYTFSFTKIGVWGYKNLNLEDHLGAISVIAQ